jgi:hypothetical protein
MISGVSVVKAQNCDITIAVPKQGEKVDATGTVEGKAKVPEKCHLWVLAHRLGLNGWWPQGGGAASVGSDGTWEVTVFYGEARDVGSKFEVAAVVVGDEDNKKLERWVAEAPGKGYPPIVFPNIVEGCPVRRVTVVRD